MGWSQDVEVDPVVGDDVVKLFALGHQLHPAREPGPRHLLVCRVPEGKGLSFLSLEFEISCLTTLIATMCCSLVAEVFLEESGELELAILDPPPLHQVQHVGAEEQNKGY